MIFNESEALSMHKLTGLAKLHAREGKRALVTRDNPTIALHFGLAARFMEEAFGLTRPEDATTRNLLAVSTVLNYANAGWHRETIRAAEDFTNSLGGQIFPRVEMRLQDFVESAKQELASF